MDRTPIDRLLPAPLMRRLEHAMATLYQPEGRALEDFSQPRGEAALTAPDSVSWRVFKNPVVLFIGGVAAVVLELAEPRVRSGVWDYTGFRDLPLQRLRRTAFATVMTVYGPRTRARALIDSVNRLHEHIVGVTPEGEPYRATDAVLLDWVQATASFGFLEAYAAYVEPLDDADRDRFYAEGRPVAQLFGATGAPDSQRALNDLFERTRPRLQPTPVVHEFLHIAAHMPGVPLVVRPLQGLLVEAALQIVPEAIRRHLGLERAWPGWQRRMACAAARTAEGLLLRSGAAVQSCRRLGLPDDYLYRRGA